MLKEVDRALAVALAVSGAMAALMLAVPLQALSAVEAALPGGAVESLLLIALFVAAAAIALTGLELVRERILRRAALWIGHMLGRHMLEDGLARGRSPAQMAADARALTTVQKALHGPLVKGLLDLVWLPLPVAAVACIEPRLGIVLAAALAGVAGAVVLHARLTARARAEAAAGHLHAEQFRQAQTHAADCDPAHAGNRWDELHRRHVAGAYRAGRRGMLPLTVARLAMRSAEIAAWAVGAWLAMAGVLSPVALVAAGLLVHRASMPIETLLASLDEVAELKAARARLDSLPMEHHPLQAAASAGQERLPPRTPSGPVRLVAVGGHTLVGRAA